MFPWKALLYFADFVILTTSTRRATACYFTAQHVGAVQDGCADATEHCNSLREDAACCTRGCTQLWLSCLVSENHLLSLPKWMLSPLFLKAENGGCDAATWVLQKV